MIYSQVSDNFKNPGEDGEKRDKLEWRSDKQDEKIKL